MSDRRFGITYNLSGLSQGIIVNSLSITNNAETAQARDERGQVIDIAVYNNETKQIAIDGLYTGQGVSNGSLIKVDDEYYLVTSTGNVETNNSFQTGSVNAIQYPQQGPLIPDQPNPSLTFTAVNGPAGISLEQNGSPVAISLQYKKNRGNWINYNIGDHILLYEGDRVAFSGANDHFSRSGDHFYYFIMAGDIEASGNIQSLMNFSNSAPTHCYNSLFRNCNTLKSAPELPATSLGQNCYKSMFLGCTALTVAPTLPATTLAQSCYSNMFNGCSSLLAAPELPAKTLQIDCYNYMFAHCTSLSSINVSFTSWNVITSTNNWLLEVAAEGEFFKPQGLSEQTGPSNIPTGWIVINK